MKISRQVIEAASWRIVCELFRRYPRRFVLVQTHPGGGQYDCLTLLDQKLQHIADFNRPGSFHVWDKRIASSPPLSEPDFWERVIESEDPRNALDYVASTLRLPDVKKLPKSTPEVLVYRLVADFLTHTVFRRAKRRCVNGFLDTSGYSGGPQTALFERFPVAKERLLERRKDDVLGEPAYRFWFICRDGDPVLCLDKDGTAWTRDGQVHDLPGLYRQHKRIWPLVWKLLGPYLP